MRILVTGRGSSGSFKIRGEQLGRAIGAEIRPRTLEVKGYDLVIVVKRVDYALACLLNERKITWVWDVLDSFPQRPGEKLSEAQAKMWLKTQLDKFKPTAVVWPNARMMKDGDFKGPQMVLYHHARPGVFSNPIRPKIESIGYEGATRYLDEYEGFFVKACAKRGWFFVTAPAALADVDVVVAFRGKDWNGYAQRRWKSNVKLANAQASGTPFVGADEDGYLETQSGGEVFCTSQDQVEEALDSLRDHSVRLANAEKMRQRAPLLPAIADEYKQWLTQLKS